MKLIKTFTLGFFLVFAFAAYSQECDISDLTVEAQECDDHGNFDVVIDFTHENTSDSFIIVGNGHNYGTFAYTDKPITLHDLAGDCETEYEFIVFDLMDRTCAEDTDEGLVVCCDGASDCSINHLTVEVHDCEDDGTYSITLDFEVSNPGDDHYDLWINNKYEGLYPLTDRPNTIDGITPRHGTEYDIVKVCINDSNCCAEKEYEHPGCEREDECDISDLTVEAQECDEHGNFDVVIDFTHENTSDSFKIVGNGHNYGTFAYTDKPITLHDLAGDCETKYEFSIIDLVIRDCYEDTDSVLVVCCDEGKVTITNLEAEIVAIHEDRTYDLEINFDIVESLVAETYEVWINAEYMGMFSTEERPKRFNNIVPLADRPDDVVKVCLTNQSDACAEEAYPNKVTATEYQNEIGLFEVVNLRNELFIRYHGTERSYQMALFDASGNILLQKRISTSEHLEQLMPSISSGLYFLRLSSRNNFMTQKLFIVVGE